MVKKLILAINTATSHTSIALLTEDASVAEDAIVEKKDVPGNGSSHKREVSILAEKSWESANNEAEKLMPEISELLKEAGSSPATAGSHKQQSAASSGTPGHIPEFRDIEKIIVVKGPGSFTGLRVGITVANTIAYLNGCEISSLNTFEYLHLNAKLLERESANSAEEIPVLLFAGKGGVYLSETSDSEPRIIDLPDLPEAIKDFSKISGDISEEQKEVLNSMEKPPQFIELKKTFGEVMKEFLRNFPPAEKAPGNVPENAPKNIPGNGSSHKKQEPAKGEINLVKPLYIKQPAITKSKKRMSFA